MKKILMIYATVVLVSQPLHAAEPVSVIPPQNKTLSSENGRFVFGQISEMRRDQYMLDTRTGRLWKLAQIVSRNTDGTSAPGDGQVVLELIPYQDAKGTISADPR